MQDWFTKCLKYWALFEFVPNLMSKFVVPLQATEQVAELASTSGLREFGALLCKALDASRRPTLASKARAYLSRCASASACSANFPGLFRSS